MEWHRLSLATDEWSTHTEDVHTRTYTANVHTADMHSQQMDTRARCTCATDVHVQQTYTCGRRTHAADVRAQKMYTLSRRTCSADVHTQQMVSNWLPAWVPDLVGTRFHRMWQYLNGWQTACLKPPSGTPVVRALVCSDTGSSRQRRSAIRVYAIRP